VIESLERTPSIIVPMIRDVPVKLRKRRPALKKWSAHEHACHLTVVHKLFFERLNLMLAEENPVIRPYWPDKKDEEGALLKMDLDKAMAKFERDRSRLVKRLRKLRNSDWDRPAIHAEYSPYSVFILFRHVVLHDMLHGYRIEELILKKDW
jgi:hypothetical protein